MQKTCQKKLKMFMFWKYGLSGNDYRVATLSNPYLIRRILTVDFLLFLAPNGGSNIALTLRGQWHKLAGQSPNLTYKKLL